MCKPQTVLTVRARFNIQRKLDNMTDLITNVSMYVSIALVLILMLRMGYAFYSSKCCNEAWDHKVVY